RRGRRPDCKIHRRLPRKACPRRVTDCLFLHLSIEQLSIGAVALALELIKGNESQGGGVDAIAQSAFLARAVWEDMTEMAVAMTGANLSPNHVMAGVSLLDHIFRLDRPGETRPAAVAVKLVKRSEQRLARYDVHVNTRLFVVPISIIKWPFRPVTLRHLVL